MSDVPGRKILEFAERLVPTSRREAWRREWLAEATYAWRAAERAGRDTTLGRLRLRARVAACILDALWERKTTVNPWGLTTELRQALRGLSRKPAFSTISVLTIALGVGATTAVFTLVDGVLLSPLPFEQPDALVSVRHEGRDGQDQLPASPGLYTLYRDQARTLESIALYTRTAVNLISDGEPQRVEGQSVTPSFFQVLRMEPELGRAFSASEGLPGAEPVILLSRELWETRFGSDASVVGRTIEVSGIERQVLGVLPAGFGYPDRNARFWIPLAIDDAQAPLATFFASAIGRVAPGQSIEAAQSEIAGFLDRLVELFPADGEAEFLQEVNLSAAVVPLKSDLVGDIQATLWVLLGTVGFVLLIACANVANLLLVRAEGRQRELALRVAIGAGRLRILRTFMAESLVLAGLGGLGGVLFASFSLGITARFIPTDIPRVDEISLDAAVLGFTAFVSLACAVFFGLVPVARYGVDNLAGMLRDGGARGATGGRGTHRLRNGLVVAQIALALVLLVGSGLMFRSFQALRTVDPGFEPAGTLTGRIIIPSGEIGGWQETAGFFRELHDRLAQQPGVQSVGMISGLPLSSAGVTFGGLIVEDHPRSPEELPIFSLQPRVEGGYFDAMGIDILAGRGFEIGDGGDGTRAVVVSRAFAERWWPGQSPLGRQIRVDDGEGWYQIVGVAEDVRQEGLDQPIRDATYFPAVREAAGAHSVSRVMDVVIRTAGPPESFIPVLRREMRAINPRIPLADPRPVLEVFDGAAARTGFTMAMLASASGIALLLGLVGIYGVISYVVSQRTREIGVRMALGASESTVRGMVVRQGLVLALVGAALGVGAAAAVSGTLDALLFGVSATDPVTYGIVAAALVSVSGLACWLPARRASGVDPSVALRAE